VKSGISQIQIVGKPLFSSETRSNRLIAAAGIIRKKQNTIAMKSARELRREASLSVFGMGIESSYFAVETELRIITMERSAASCPKSSGE
jgi:hypothetical protein